MIVLSRGLYLLVWWGVLFFSVIVAVFLVCFQPAFAVYNEEAATTGKNAIEINNMKVTIIRGKVIYAYLLLNMTIQAKNEEIFARMKRLEPLIASTFFVDIYGAMNDLWIPNRDPKAATVQKRFQRILDKIMQPEEAKVYIGTFYVHRM